MSYKEIIKKNNKMILDYLDRYLKIENKEPLMEAKITKLKDIITKLEGECVSFETEALKFDEILVDNFSQTIASYNEKEEKLKAQLNERLAENKRLFENVVEDLNLNIETAKIKNENQEMESNFDVEGFINSSNQYVEKFKKENLATIDHLGYLFQSSKESYASSIIKYNNQLQDRLRAENERYKSRLESYDEETKELIMSYSKEVAKKEEKLEDANLEYSALNKKFQDIRKKESTELNTEIRKHVRARNDEISIARNNYSNSQDIVSKEREEKKNTYQEESKKTTREFVYNVNELEKEENRIKDIYLNDLRNEKNYRSYSLLKIHRQQEEELRNLYENNPNSFSTRFKAKRINRSYHKHKKLAEYNSDNAIKRLNQNFENNMLRSDYDKKILDIGRSVSFDVLNEKEIRDNKYYQELNNLYENTLNFNIYKANNKYTEVANEVRLESDIKGVDISKDFEEDEAACQIKIETLTSEIKKENLEINLARDMQNLIHKYEDIKHDKLISYHTVSNLLKIERFKVLDNYNTRTYDLNVESANNDLDYAIKRMNLQNEKYEALNKEKIKIAKKELEKYINYTEYQILEQEINHLKEDIILRRNYNYESDVIVQNVLDNRFINEIKKLNYISSVYTSIINKLSYLLNKYIEITTSDLSIPLADSTFILKYVNDMLKLIIGYYYNVLDSLKAYIEELIDSRIKFEDNFKFKKIADETKNNYEKDVAAIKNRINEEQGKITLINNIIDENKKAVYNLQFDTIQEKRNKNPDLNKLAIYKEKLENHYSEIKANENILQKQEKFVLRIKEELKSLELTNQDNIKSLKEIQHNNAIAYYNLKNNISVIHRNIIVRINNDYDNYLKSINQKFSTETLFNFIDSVTSNFDEAGNKLYSVIKNFNLEAINNNKITMGKIVEKYEADVNKINNNHSEKIKEEKEKFNERNEDLINELRKLHIEKDNVEDRFNILISDNDLLKQKNVDFNIEKRKKNTNQFYIELYAVNDNKNDIDNDHKEFMEKNDLEFENNKAKLINDVNKECHNIDLELKNYIASKKEFVSQLPTVIKERKRELVENNKLKQRELEELLKKENDASSLREKDLNKLLEQIYSNCDEAIGKINIKEKKQKLKEKKTYYSKRLKIKAA